MQKSASTLLTGLSAMLVTLLIWSSFFLSLRAASHSSLTTADIALLRFVPAALLFGWCCRSRFRAIFATPKRYLALIAWGAGLPYFLIAGWGLQAVPVADGASLIPGILPLFVSGIAAFYYRESISAARRVGLCLIAVGIACFVYKSLINGQPNLLKGYGILLFASLSWAWYTIAMRVSGLTAIEGAAVIAISGCILLALGSLSGTVTFNLTSAGSQEILYHFLVQGIGVGMVSSLCYAMAISRLGAEVSAALGAFTPVLAAALAFPFFSEPLTSQTLLAMAFVVFGAITASEVLPLRLNKSLKKAFR
ncbi:DMT family transporter [Photobacterium sp. 1_MG-2023]|uniref:DMT family transporter n=1 Tax=Photobacterium sp. 1_MG-2023 TaxID=3062646 RepID=UPI0026E17ED3|nr:DMT family transporter [Photobacterium sp. 1_MG-2023]MDO6708884.1 DMT family transporter [Photobacterium sp. 1_MG-2023]